MLLKPGVDVMGGGAGAEEHYISPFAPPHHLHHQAPPTHHLQHPQSHAAQLFGAQGPPQGPPLSQQQQQQGPPQQDTSGHFDVQVRGPPILQDQKKRDDVPASGLFFSAVLSPSPLPPEVRLPAALTRPIVARNTSAAARSSPRYTSSHNLLVNFKAPSSGSLGGSSSPESGGLIQSSYLRFFNYAAVTRDFGNSTPALSPREFQAERILLASFDSLLSVNEPASFIEKLFLIIIKKIKK